MQKSLQTVEDLSAANSVSVDQLLTTIFGEDGPAKPFIAESLQPPVVFPSTAKFKKNVKFAGEWKPATFSQLMTLAHNINRRMGHLFTKGCHCHQCETNRKLAQGTR